MNAHNHYVKPEDHPSPKNCRFCKKHPWCPACHGHHGPHAPSVPKVDGPRPVRVVVLKGGGVEVIADFPDGVQKDEDELHALGYAKSFPGAVTAVEKRGTWFDADRWERFLTVGPFDARGEPVPVRDEGLEYRRAYLAECQRRAEERERLAQTAKSVADARRKRGRGRR